MCSCGTSPPAQNTTCLNLPRLPRIIHTTISGADHLSAARATPLEQQACVHSMLRFPLESRNLNHERTPCIASLVAKSSQTSVVAICRNPPTCQLASPCSCRVSSHHFSREERAEVAINFPLPASSYIRRFDFRSASQPANQPSSQPTNQPTNQQHQPREITHFDSFPLRSSPTFPPSTCFTSRAHFAQLCSNGLRFLSRHLSPWSSRLSLVLAASSQEPFDLRAFHPPLPHRRICASSAF
jgi:hypothetical protein